MSSLRLRPARPSDLPAVEKLCASRRYYDSVFMPAERLRDFTLGHLRANFGRLFDEETPDVQMWLACEDEMPVGFAVLFLHTRETITQENQTLVFDFAAPSYDVLALLLEKAVQVTRQAQDDYLVIHLQEEAKKEQIWCYRLGFRPELNRVVKRIPAGHVGPSHPRYLARPARMNEHLFIVRVNAEYADLYRPAGRDTPGQIIKASFVSCYVGLNLADQGYRYLILEDREHKKAAGYIILVEHELPDSQGRDYYTYDVAVAPEYTGRGLSLYLCGAAETLMGVEGGGLLFGDTSLANVAAVNGDRQLGFVVDSKRWGLDCRSPNQEREM